MNKGLHPKSIEKSCGFCGTKFWAWNSYIKRGESKYCSWKCYIKARIHPDVQRFCSFCGKEFWVKYGLRDQMYCSRRCIHIGKIPSKATREKMSKVRKGKRRPKISEALKGERNGRWQGGKSFEPYNSEFNEQLKELIRHRDGYKCQLCGCPEIENGRKLDVHHIDYDKNNCKPLNLISLCSRCNTKVNSNRLKWIKYFKRKVRKIMKLNAIQLNFRFKKIKGQTIINKGGKDE